MDHIRIKNETSEPVPVTITGGSSSGTEYTEGDMDATIAGPAMMMEVAADTLQPVQGTVADGLLVNLGGNNDVTLGAALPAGNNNIGDVDVATVPAPLSTTGGGTEATALRVTLASDSTGLVSVDDNGGSLTVDAPVGTPVFVRLSDGAAAITTLPVSLATVPSHAVTNAGTFAVQVDGNALTALQKIDDPVLVDDAAFTPATSSVMMAGFEADETATDSVDEGDAGAARMTLDRKQIVNPQPHTTGGLSIFRSLDIDETEEEVKATAGQVYGWVTTNFATTTRHVKFYNATTANVTVGTTTPVITISIPGNATDDTMAVSNHTMGIEFATAITVAATTGLADNDTGAPGANELIINLGYA